ncbi:hypothetical protein [Paenibacillus popilliae]|uniref:Uncharacterized protein n=1 Tax=Paenibacillus popilliae ATCC 14706 TaxID=1212764 RepID=M9L919_PAEPP|nr:hypothetical protein [Paenibacillus popilliae]GAC41812.1 hypothetical protein PPOP_1169 [Paenibacillus popilliae ATCC 14706]
MNDEGRRDKEPPMGDYQERQRMDQIRTPDWNREEEQFLRRRMANLEHQQRQHQHQHPGNYPPYEGMPPVSPVYGTPPQRKSKFLSLLLSFIFPGSGHFYLGLMQRGLLIMMLFALDIVAIVYFSATDARINVPLVVLLALMLPVIYFFNLFDALQSTERVNQRAVYGLGADNVKQDPWLGLLLLFGGVVLLLFTVDPAWLRWFFSNAGSYAGAAVLIGGGIFLLIKESRKRH